MAHAFDCDYRDPSTDYATLQFRGDSILNEDQMAERGAASDKAAPEPSHVALDLLRGLAAIIVLLVHVRGAAFVEYGALPPDDQTPVVWIFYAATRLGHEAVLIFFVLSGFLVGGQVIRQVRGRRFEPALYAADRISRIYPTLLVACGFTVVTNILSLSVQPDWLQIAGHLAGLNGPIVPTLLSNAPLWSLAYEIWFYVLAGTMALAIMQRSPLLAVAGLSLATLVFAYLDARYVLVWGLGALVAGLGPVRQKTLLCVVGSIFTVAGIALYELGTTSRSFETVKLLSTPAAEAVFCVGIAALIPLLVDTETDRRLRWLAKPAGAIAAISYSLYLFHYPINGVIEPWFGKADDLNMESLLRFGARVLVVTVLVLPAYFAVEAQTPKVRTWLRRQFARTKRR